MQELLQFSGDQIQDSLYLRRIVAARAHDLEQQRHQASAHMLSQAAVKQHPSDHLAASKATSEQLNLIGMDEYKLHGIATDALFNGVCYGAHATDHLLFVTRHVATPQIERRVKECNSVNELPCCLRA